MGRPRRVARAERDGVEFDVSTREKIESHNWRKKSIMAALTSAARSCCVQ
jgi:hypothetical protein